MRIPYDIVKQLHELNCEDVATRFGIDVKGHMAHCFKHVDRIPSLGFKGNHWKCFSCDVGGDAISFMQERFSISFTEACVILCDEFHIHIPENGYKNEAWKKSIIPVHRSSYTTDTVSVFDKDVAEFIMGNTQLTEIGRAFLIDERKDLCSVVKNSNIHSVENPNTLKDKLISSFGIDRLIKSKVLKDDARYLTIDSPSLIIPYYDEKNTLIGLQTRFLGDDNPNYHISRFKRICNSQIRIYNLPILNTIPYGGSLYITEGITDCLAMLSSGYTAVAIPSATSFPLDDLRKLRGFNLFMMSDQDKAGDESYIKLYRMMLRYGCILKKVSLPNGYKDYSDYYLNSLNKNVKRK